MPRIVGEAVDEGSKVASGFCRGVLKVWEYYSEAIAIHAWVFFLSDCSKLAGYRAQRYLGSSFDGIDPLSIGTSCG
jgi:hypothetical protein